MAGEINTQLTRCHVLALLEWPTDETGEVLMHDRSPSELMPRDSQEDTQTHTGREHGVHQTAKRGGLDAKHDATIRKK